jgi:class 3 adenylate cyclase
VDEFVGDAVMAVFRGPEALGALERAWRPGSNCRT